MSVQIHAHTITGNLAHTHTTLHAQVLETESAAAFSPSAASPDAWVRMLLVYAQAGHIPGDTWWAQLDAATADLHRFSTPQLAGLLRGFGLLRWGGFAVS